MFRWGNASYEEVITDNSEDEEARGHMGSCSVLKVDPLDFTLQTCENAQVPINWEKEKKAAGQENADTTSLVDESSEFEEGIVKRMNIMFGRIFRNTTSYAGVKSTSSDIETVIGEEETDDGRPQIVAGRNYTSKIPNKLPSFHVKKDNVQCPVKKIQTGRQMTDTIIGINEDEEASHSGDMSSDEFWNEMLSFKAQEASEVSLIPDCPETKNKEEGKKQ